MFLFLLLRSCCLFANTSLFLLVKWWSNITLLFVKSHFLLAKSAYGSAWKWGIPVYPPNLPLWQGTWRLTLGTPGTMEYPLFRQTHWPYFSWSKPPDFLWSNPYVWFAKSQYGLSENVVYRRYNFESARTVINRSKVIICLLKSLLFLLVTSGLKSRSKNHLYGGFRKCG